MVFGGCCLIGFAIVAAGNQGLLPIFLVVISTFLIFIIAIVFWIRAARAHFQLRAMRGSEPRE